MRIQRAATLYLDARRADLARLTLRAHRYRLESFTEHVGPDTALKAIRPHHIQDWLAANTWAPSTARNHLGITRTFFAWCHTNGYTKTNPAATIRGPRQPRALPRELDTEQITRIFAACPDTRAAALVSLIFHEGLRRVELWGLDIGDFDREIVCVTGKGGHQRILPLSDQSYTAIHRYLADHPAASGPLFRSYQHPTRRLHPDTIGIIVSRVFTDSGVKEHAHDGRSAHAGRHTFAGAMLDAGADIRTVAAALGHAHVTTTAVYLKRRQGVADIRPFLPNYTKASPNGNDH